MRAENVIGVAFFVALLTGLGLIVYGSQRKDPAARSLWHGRGFVVEGLAFVVFGLLTDLMIRSSKRLLVDGNIWAIHQSHGKSSGTNFLITTEAGTVESVRCRYDGPGLREGDRARVHFLEYNRKLLALQMLSGPYEGWELRESSGEGSYWVIAGVGVICWLAAYGRLRSAEALAQKNESA